jgi:tetratricopeptide (TPR) repeat protein
MPAFNAFVAHSFSDGDDSVVGPFLNFLDHVAAMGLGFTWDHAEPAEPRDLRDKVLAKLEGKNLLIAICTAHERAIAPQHLKKVTFSPGQLKASTEHLNPKASDWIIQEIGCAVGRAMRIIVLLERGLRVPGGLQGDIEYVEFDRERPELSFNKLLEMLRSLSEPPPAAPAPAAGGASPAAREEPAESAAAPRDEEPDEAWTRTDFDNALLDSIVLDDEQRSEKLTVAYYNIIAKDDQRQQARWDALRLYYQASIKKKDTLSGILAIKDKYPDQPDILSLAARAYETYDEYNTAAGLFESSSLLTDELPLKVRRLCRAAVDYAQAGHYDTAQKCLSRASSIQSQDEATRQDVFAAYADSGKISTYHSVYEAFTEALLELRPDDNHRRAALGWHYIEEGQHDLALYHFGVVVARSPEEGHWNNYGVAAANLNLPATSVKAYRESQRLGGTLAMSNLAHKFLNEGFLQEAEQIAIDAMKQDSYDKQVGSVLPRMRSIDQEEAKKVEQLLQALQRRRHIHIAFANAAMASQPLELSRLRKGYETPLTISIEDGLLRATGRHEKKATGFAPQLAVALGQKEAGVTPVHTLLAAPLLGRSGTYRLWVKEGKPPDPDSDKPAHTGLLVISDDVQSINIYKAGSRETEAFYRLTPAENTGA